MNPIDRALQYYNNYGFSRFAKKVLGYPFVRLRHKQFRESLKGQSAAEVFDRIYRENVWSESESRSGGGSTLVATQSVRAHLPTIFEKWNVKKFVDAPCGDFNWMQSVAMPVGTTYVGGDIVPEIVRSNQQRFSDSQHRFITLNILEDALPDADLMLCRDCLLHFSNNDIFRFFENFARSNIPLLLLNTHTDTEFFHNIDIHTGDFRQLDLFGEPFSLSKDVLYRLDDYSPGQRPRDLCLWSREQIAEALRKHHSNSAARS